MLSCLLNEKRINCYDGQYSKEQLKKWANKKILICPACGKPYEYCHGKVKSPYFRHMDKAECEDKYSEPETEEHINGKKDLYEWIKKQPGITDCILEGWIATTKQRPDIMFKYKDKQYVLEYQCTPIASEYIERHELYQAAGINDIWICGTERVFNTSREKYLESVVFAKYNTKTEELDIFDYEQNRCLLYIPKINEICESNKSLDSFKFNGKIVYSCLANQDYSQIVEKHNNRKVAKDQDKINAIYKLEDKFYWVKENIKSQKITLHTPNHWDKSKAYIRFFRNSDYTIDTDKQLYLKINDFYKTYELSKIIKTFSNDNWCFFIAPTNKAHKISVELYSSNCYSNGYWDGHIFSKEISYETVKRMCQDEEYLKSVLLDMMKQCKYEALNLCGEYRFMENR